MSMILNGKKSLLNVNLIEGGGVKEPEKAWFFPTEYNENGYVVKAKAIGQSGEMPSSFLYASGSNRLNTTNLYLEEFSGTDEVTSIGYGSFASCVNLKRVSFANATTINRSAFDNCLGLTSIAIPKVETIMDNAFLACRALTSISLPKVTSIGTSAFANSYALTSITLGANRVCTISSTNSIPASSTQHITIKVPADLIESYKTATNWSTHYNNGYITFEAIE